MNNDASRVIEHAQQMSEHADRMGEHAKWVSMHAKGSSSAEAQKEHAQRMSDHAQRMSTYAARMCKQSPETGPTAATEIRWSIGFLAIGGLIGAGVLFRDVYDDAKLNDGTATLPQLFPSWFVALAAGVLLLKLIASTPSWPDSQSIRLGAWLKFVGDLFALLAASYAAIVSITAFVYRWTNGSSEWSDLEQFLALCPALLVLLSLTSVLLWRRKV